MMDKHELIEFLDGEIRGVKENIAFKDGMNWCAQLVERYLDLNEPEITTEQAWEKIAEKFEEGPKELCATLVSALPPYNLSEKPEIPKFVADWIEEKSPHYSVMTMIGNYLNSFCMAERVAEWVTDNEDDFIKAIVNGYTIEKEPVWVVLQDAQYFHAFTGEYDKFEGFEYVLSMYEGNAHTFADKQKAEAVATLVDGTVKEWSE